jgi:hypothetical protein
MNRDSDNNRMLIGIIGGAVLIVLTMMVSIFIATRRPVVVVIPGAGSGAQPLAAPALAPGAAPTVAAAAPAELKVTKAERAPGIDNPFDPSWDKIAVVEVNLLPQQAAPPVLETGTVAKLRVQAVRDQQRYVWRLSWDQPLASDRSDVGEFSDAVAMQFPLTDGAPYTMGGPKMPVRMLYWKATWQKDVDLGFQDLNSIHPNSDSDFYWFVSGEPPYLVSKFDDPMAQQWMIAASAGNPMVDFHRKHPLEELTAHGFGSSTHIDETPSRGRGVWKDGQWFVVIDRPIDTSDPLITRFNENLQQQLIAFAVWDGSADNRGARKNITNWIVMRIDP